MKLLADQAGQPRPGPQIGREPVLGRLVGQPSADDLLLGMGQLGRPTHRWPSNQTLFTNLPELSDPSPHRAGIATEEVGDFLGRVPLQNALDG